MSVELQQLESAMRALEAQRPMLGDALVDTALAPMRARSAELRAAALAPERLLKQVTVLFLDVVGSTALSQHLDPEDIQQVMDGLLARCTAAVAAHGGKVLQYAGDSLLAAFGTEGAREGDAEQAVRAGLALLTEGRTQREAVRQRFGYDSFGVRVGIHTGSVLLGGGVDEGGTIRGITVNIAARMEQTAPPGALRISHDTYHHVRGVFDVEAQEPLQVKGHDGALQTYLVTGAKPRAFRLQSRGIEGLDTPMVGREAERARLLQLLGEAAGQRRLKPLTLVAEAGLGKSRLVQEFQAALELDRRSFWLLLGRADAAQQLQPYGLLRDLLAWRLEIADSDSAEVAKAKLVEGLAPWLGERGEAKARLIGQLIGLDFQAHEDLHGVAARELRDRGFAALTAWLRGLAASDGFTVVLLLEDLHWADDGSLDYLEHLQHEHEPLALALVMTARPALLERRASWAVPEATLTLAPLGVDHSNALADALLCRLDTVPQRLRELLVGQAGGNPFYMEELLRMFIDDGVIVVDAETWHVLPDRLRLARVPTTLVGVLQARLDALTPLERSALQHASIVGPVFWDDAVDALEARAGEQIAGLQDKSLVVRQDGSAFEGTSEEFFKHHLLHQVTYDTVLKTAKREGHARAAAWLAGRVGDRADEYLAIAARHFELAGDGAKALDYLERAAKAAKTRYANREALAYLERALALPELDDPQRRFRVLDIQAEMADRLGDRSLQGQALQAQARLAETVDDDALRAESLVNLALLADRRGDHDTAVALASQAVALAEHVGPAHVASVAHGELAWVNFCRGASDTALFHARESMRWGQQAALPPESRPVHEMQACVMLSFIHQNRFEFDEARAALKRGLPLAQAAGSLQMQSMMQQSLGTIATLLGDWRLGETHHEQSLVLARQVGWRTNEIVGLFNLAQCVLERGDVAATLAMADQASELAERAEDHSDMARIFVLRGDAHLAAGAFDAALAAYSESRARYQKLGNEPYVAINSAVMGDVLLKAGRPESAVAETNRALQAMAEGVSLAGTGEDLRVRWLCFKVLDAVADPRAAPYLDTLHADLQAVAAHIADLPTRGQFLDRQGSSREIVAAWIARQPSAPGSRG